MAMEILIKQSASGIQMIMICLMSYAQNDAAQKATHTATHTAMNFPTNTTVRHASGKRRNTNMRQQPREKWEVQNVIVSTTPASEGVVGLIKS